MKKWLLAGLLFSQSVMADCYSGGMCITPPGLLTIVYRGMELPRHDVCPLDYLQLVRGNGSGYLLIQGCGMTWFIDFLRSVVTYTQEGNNVYIYYTDFLSSLALDALFVYDFE